MYTHTAIEMLSTTFVTLVNVKIPLLCQPKRKKYIHASAESFIEFNIFIQCKIISNRTSFMANINPRKSSMGIGVFKAKSMLIIVMQCVLEKLDFYIKFKQVD